MITVITHTRYDRPELLERCKASVAAALPTGGQHLILEKTAYSDWVHSRVHDAKAHDLVAFVDDDDTIHPDALHRSIDALSKHDVGAAVTDEVEVDVAGATIKHARGHRTYNIAAIHPRVVHHLCVLRGNLIDTKAITLHEKFCVGIDWFIRQSVVQRHGCVQVPMYGYNWTQHEGQHTSATATLYQKHLRQMGLAIRETWPARFQGALPVAKM